MALLEPGSKPFYYRLAMVLFSILALGYLAVIGKQVLCPLIFGFLFAILLLPFANWIEKKLHVKRIAASGLAVFLMVIALVGLVWLISAQLIRVSQDMPLLREQLTGLLKNTQQWLFSHLNIPIEEQDKFFTKTAKSLQKSTPSFIGTTVLSASSILLFLVFIILDTFFILAYRKMLLQFLLDVFLKHNAGHVLDIIAKVQYIIRNYIIGLFLEMLTVAVVCCIVFLILGIKYAVLLSLITALFNIIPYIGIFCALIINVVIVFATSALLSKVLYVAITIVVIHLIDSNILLPVIVGSKVRINAFITILGVVIGEMLWGISGMFLSIPVIAIAKIIFDRVEHLNPWGHLLGYETFEKKSLTNKKKEKAKVNVVLKQKTGPDIF